LAARLPPSAEATRSACLISASVKVVVLLRHVEHVDALVGERARHRRVRWLPAGRSARSSATMTSAMVRETTLPS